MAGASSGALGGFTVANPLFGPFPHFGIPLRALPGDSLQTTRYPGAQPPTWLSFLTPKAPSLQDYVRQMGKWPAMKIKLGTAGEL